MLTNKYRLVRLVLRILLCSLPGRGRGALPLHESKVILKRVEKVCKGS